VSVILHIPLTTTTGKTLSPGVVYQIIQLLAGRVIDSRVSGILGARTLIVKVKHISVVAVSDLVSRLRVQAISFGDTVARFQRWVRAAVVSVFSLHGVWEDTAAMIYEVTSPKARGVKP